jgi:hypothetical protein
LFYEVTIQRQYTNRVIPWFGNLPTYFLVEYKS